MSGEKRKQRVVVVGGGIAGANVARALQSEALVSLVDPKDYLEIPYAALRNTVEPSFAERSIVSYSEFLTQVELVQSAAVSVSAKPAHVVTSSGRNLPFDFLVISTGASPKGAVTRRERIQEFVNDNHALKRANSILVVGGGPVGVELAGEIVTDFPDKSVSLVQSGSRLIDFLGPSASAKALNWLTSKSVRVLLSERVPSSSLSPPVFTTSSGKEITADAHFVCTGSKVSSSWLKGTFLEESLNEQGRLKVESSLLVTGTRNVFACGDVTDLKEIKQGFLAEKHAKVVAANIRKLSGNEKANLSSYKPLGQPMGLVSLGRHAAVAQLPIGTFVGWIPGLIKSKDLFVGKTRKGLGCKGCALQNRLLARCKIPLC